MTDLFKRKYKLVIGFGDSLLNFNGVKLSGGNFLERAMGVKDLSLVEAEQKGLIDLTDTLNTSKVNDVGQIVTSSDVFEQGIADTRLGLGTETVLSSVNTSGYVVTDYQMTAEISYDKNSNSRRPSCLIKVFNLPDEVVRYVRQPLVLVNLYCGYETSTKEIPLLCYGRAKDIVTSRDGVDVVTQFTITQTLPFQKSSQISFPFKPPTDSATIMSRFIDAWRGYGVPLGYLDWGKPERYNIYDEETETYRAGGVFRKDEIAFKKGASFSGTLEKTFTDFCDSIGMKWNIFAGSLYIYSPSGISKPFTIEDEGVTYTSEEGYLPLNTSRRSLGVNEPEPEDTTFSFDRRIYYITENQVIGKVGDYMRTVFSENTEEKDSGLTLRILLDSRLIPNTLVRVYLGERSDKSGDYIISSVKHKLDYRGNDWYSELELTSAELLLDGDTDVVAIRGG